MRDEFLLVHKSVLPDLFPAVIQARSLIEKDGYSVTKACQELNISRSAYYKYRDVVFLPDDSVPRKAILSFKVDDEPGVLDALLRKLYDFSINVLTIHQDMPIRHVAYITMTLNINNLRGEISELIKALSQTGHVRKASIISYE